MNEKTKLSDIEDHIQELETQNISYNPACEDCCKEKKHCEECPNPICETCADIGSFCGYCNFDKYIDHAGHCEKLIKKWGIEGQYEVVVADDLHLQIDCDNLEDVKFCLKQLKILQPHVKIEGFKITKSKSGNRHVIIKLGEQLDAYKRIALQAILGSDRVREILNFISTYKEHGNPILLIEDVRTKDQTWVTQ